MFQIDFCTPLPNVFINPPAVKAESPSTRRSSLEEIGPEQSLSLDDGTIRNKSPSIMQTHEFSAYWHKAHRLLKTIPRDNKIGPGKLE